MRRSGATTDNTVTVKVQTLLLPLASVAVLVTVVVPAGKAKPLGGTLTKLVTTQLSDALTRKVTLLVSVSGTASTVKFAGQASWGGCVSWTVTVNVHTLLLPLLSNAVLVTVVTPTGNSNPLAGTLVRFVTWQLSVAVTVNVTLAVHIAGARFIVIGPAQLIVGG
jgi:hypothetical protein